MENVEYIANSNNNQINEVVSITDKINKISPIIMIVLACIIFLGIVFLINKKILKKEVKEMWKTALIGWCIVFFINVFCMITHMPFAIGIPGDMCMCGFGKYYSLGYVINVDVHSISD